MTEPMGSPAAAIAPELEVDATIAMLVVHYRDPAGVHELVRSVDTWTLRPGSIVIVDNSGELSGTDLAETPAITVVQAGSNLGYAGAINLAVASIADTGVTSCLICTQDARLDLQALELMQRARRADESIEICAPTLLFQSRPGVIFSRGAHLSGRAVVQHVDYDRPFSPEAPHTGPSPVDFADGAILLVGRRALERRGGFPDEYFLYVEEVDFALQVRRGGGKVVVCSDAIGYQEPGNYRPYLQFRNSTWLTRKYRDQFRPWPWFAFLRRGIWNEAKRGRLFPVLPALKGVLHASRGRMGKPPE